MGEESGRRSGRVRLLVSNRGSGRVNILPGRVQEKWPVDNCVSEIWSTLSFQHLSEPAQEQFNCLTWVSYVDTVSAVAEAGSSRGVRPRDVSGHPSEEGNDKRHE